MHKNLKMEKLAKLIELKNRGYNLTKNYTLESDYDGCVLK